MKLNTYGKFLCVKLATKLDIMRSKFIGNRWSMLIHKADCHLVNMMSEPQAINSQEEAIEKGYKKPCKLCQPFLSKVVNIENQLNKYNIDHLHYMAPIENIPSILQKGILCHNMIKIVSHHDFSLRSVQKKRAKTIIEEGNQSLHDYVPLYFATHTPMQYVLTQKNCSIEQANLIFIEVDAIAVFQISGTIFTDGHAAKATAFYDDISVLDKLDWNIIFNIPNCYSEEYKYKKAAEVLVPKRVPSKYFNRIVTYSHEVKNELIKRIRLFARKNNTTTNLLKFHIDIDPTHYY